jgi:adenylate cyclase
VSDYSRQDIAERAGVDPEYVSRLVELGILSPGPDDRFIETDQRRVSIIRSLDAAGLPLEGIAKALQRGDLSLGFVEQPSYSRYGSVGSETFRQLSVRTGLPIDLLLVIREAMGFAQPQPDDRVRDDELAVVPLLELEIAQGFRPAVIERSLRTFGDSLRRIADTEGDLFRTEIQIPMIQAGKGIAEIGEVASRFGPDLERFGDQAILALYHGQQGNALLRNILAGFEIALANAGLFSRLDHPPAICFLDLTGYTRLTDERGDEAAADTAGRLARLVERTSAKHGGKPVKWLGDGVMFYFREPGPGVAAALEMVEGASDAGLPPAHVGLHAGPVLFQEGDYFGRTVNVAARIADYARQGEVLVSQEVVEAAGEAGITFEEIGPVELKGVSGAIRLHVARRPH